MSLQNGSSQASKSYCAACGWNLLLFPTHACIFRLASEASTKSSYPCKRPLVQSRHPTEPFHFAGDFRLSAEAFLPCTFFPDMGRNRCWAFDDRACSSETPANAV